MKERTHLRLQSVIAEPRPAIRAKFCNYLSRLSDIERVYEATTVQEIEKHLSTHPTHLILLSQALLNEVAPLPCKCFLLLTTQNLDVETLYTMYYTGVEGYLHPDVEQEEFQLAFPLMLLKQTHVFFLDPTTKPLLKGEELNIMTRAKFAMLSEREREILYLRNQGVNNAAIAQQLFITEDTVRTHIKHLRDKLEVTNDQLSSLHLPERPTHPPSPPNT